MIRALALAVTLSLLAAPARAACEDLHWESPDGREAVTWYAGQNLLRIHLAPQAQGGAGDRAGEGVMSLTLTPLRHGDAAGRFWERDTVRISLSPPPVYDLSAFTGFHHRLGFGDGRTREVRHPRVDPYGMDREGRVADRWWTDLRDRGVYAATRGSAASDALEQMRRQGSLRVEQVGRRNGRREVIAFAEFGFGRFAPLWTRLEAHRVGCAAGAQ